MTVDCRSRIVEPRPVSLVRRPFQRWLKHLLAASIQLKQTNWLPFTLVEAYVDRMTYIHQFSCRVLVSSLINVKKTVIRSLDRSLLLVQLYQHINNYWKMDNFGTGVGNQRYADVRNAVRKRPKPHNNRTKTVKNRLKSCKNWKFGHLRNQRTLSWPVSLYIATRQIRSWNTDKR